MPGFTDFNELMDSLGKFKTAVSCLYIKKIEDIDIEILKKLIKESVIKMQNIYPKD